MVTIFCQFDEVAINFNFLKRFCYTMIENKLKSVIKRSFVTRYCSFCATKKKKIFGVGKKSNFFVWSFILFVFWRKKSSSSLKCSIVSNTICAKNRDKNLDFISGLFLPNFRPVWYMMGIKNRAWNRDMSDDEDRLLITGWSSLLITSYFINSFESS